MSVLTPPFAVRLGEDQFVGDLANLFRRHRVRTGSPQYLTLLASTLEANPALRSDLLMLCNAISRMSASDLAPEELLEMVARAVAGPRSRDAELAIPNELRDQFLAGWQQWQARAESLTEMYWGPVASEPDTMDSAQHKAFPAPPSREAAAARAPSQVAPDTPIGQLTISQLRTYLDDIEQRVERLQPLLANLQPDRLGIPLAPAHQRPEPLPASFGKYAVDDSIEPAAPELTAEQTPPTEAPEPVTTPAQVIHASADSDLSEPLQAPVPAFEPAPHPEPILRLRSVGADLEDSRPTSIPSPVLFRSLSQPEPARSRGFFWTAAALVLLAPAVYFGKSYLYPPPSSMPLSPPAAAPAVPAQVLPEHSSAVAANPAPFQPHTFPQHAIADSRPAANPRLLPKAVRMEAEAARAEARDAR